MSAETPIRFNPTLDVRTSTFSTHLHKMCVSVWRRTRATRDERRSGCLCTEARGPWPAKWARVLVSRCVGVETAFLVRVGLTTQVEPRDLTHPAPTYPRSISSFFTPRLPASVRSQPTPTHKRHFPSHHPSIHPSFTYPYPYACVSSEPLTSDSPTAHQPLSDVRTNAQWRKARHDSRQLKGPGVWCVCPLWTERVLRVIRTESTRPTSMISYYWSDG